MKLTTRRMFYMLGAVLVLVALLALGFFLHIRQLIASAPKPGPQTVSTTEAKTLEWQPQLSAIGTLVAVRGVDVTTELAGLVRSVDFTSGQQVKAGTVLVQLNADADKAQLLSLQAAANLAASVLARDKLQFDAEAISQAQLDSDASDLKSKQALAAQQQATIDKKTIRAPFAGKIGITTVNKGQYLNPGDKIVTLQTIDPIHIDFSLPQQRVAELRPGQVVQVTSEGATGRRFPGRITAINSKVDPTTRNVLIRATLDNREQLLLPGMFANVDVEVGDKKRYLTLPQTAITYNPYGSTVYIVTTAAAASAAAARASDAGSAGGSASAPASAPAPQAAASGGNSLVAQQVFVTTGEQRGDQVAILKGVQPGQQIVTSGQLKLKNGTPVLIDNTVRPSDNPNPAPQEK